MLGDAAYADKLLGGICNLVLNMVMLFASTVSNSELPTIAGIVLLVVGAIHFGWFRILKETNRLLSDQNNELKKANAELKNQHDDSLRQLSTMQGQIDVLKSIPLVNIDSTLKEISKFNKNLAESNREILRTLKNSAQKLEDTKHSAADIADNTSATAEAVQGLAK